MSNMASSRNKGFGDEDGVDAAFEASFDENHDLDDDQGFPTGYNDSEGDTDGPVPHRNLLSIDTGATMRGLQQYDEKTKEADFVYAAEAGADNRQRDWTQKMQYYTGSGVLLGAVVGSTYGTIEGYRAVKGSGARLLANSVMNSAGGRGAKLANALGCLGLLYSTTGWLTTFARDDAITNDQYNSVVAAGLTGLLYKSTSKTLAPLPSFLASQPSSAVARIYRTGFPKVKWVAITTLGFSVINWADIQYRRGALKRYGSSSRKVAPMA